MPKYTVKSHLQHDGAEYNEGDTIELEEDVAKELVEGGTIVAEGEGGESTEGGENSGSDSTSETDAEKHQYKVLVAVEFPEGTSHEVDAVLELTEVEAEGLPEGSVEKVDESENL